MNKNNWDSWIMLFLVFMFLGMGMWEWGYRSSQPPATATSVIKVPVMYLPNGVSHVTGNWFVITDPSTGKWLEMVTSTLPTSSPEVVTVESMQEEIYALQQRNAGLERVIAYYTSTTTPALDSSSSVNTSDMNAN
jgi:hypothetical protein